MSGTQNVLSKMFTKLNETGERLSYLWLSQLKRNSSGMKMNLHIIAILICAKKFSISFFYSFKLVFA